jgi:tRNA G10  N-methylase Trm11
MQQFKSVYFADIAASTAKQKNIKIAFGPGDKSIFERISSMSSAEIRRAIGAGSFAEVRRAAESASLSVNAFCLERLRRAAEGSSKTTQLTLLEADGFPSLSMDPVHATFRGGIEEPLHDWFPYLEGYSPDFVTSVLDSFAPRAKHVLDPFGGGGTTPLTVARRGARGSYCELNPVLQFLIETKADVLALDHRERESTARTLRLLPAKLESELDSHVPDRRLSEAYRATFGTSEFFPAETYDLLLRVRSWLDSLACTAPIAAAIATVAAAATLVPVSHLIRRGDLRFRKGSGEERLRIGHAVQWLGDRIQQMARAVEQLTRVAERPLLISGDAKRLHRCAPLDVDAIVTSPPYLNGTNYYRNTKLELWFIRALLDGRDLAAFRRQTVTAGINDVTSNRTATSACAEVESVVSALRATAYDSRIPLMVLHYFSDMGKVIDGLTLHAKPGAPLLLDIGDSVYAGIHVDTPRILLQILQDKGWAVRREVTLRERLSRSGVPLRQVLLCADAPKRVPSARSKAPDWKKRWEWFKCELPHQKGEYAKRNWGSPLHSLCSYQGKMKPSLARYLVESFVTPGSRMLDPFGGVGTIPFEAASIGALTWSFDISPAAVPIAAAKLQPASLDECGAVLKDLREFVSGESVRSEDRLAAEEIHFNGPLSGYFHSKTFDEVLLARRYFQEQPPTSAASSMIFSALLHVLHGNRPYALSRRSHPITPFAPSGASVYKNLGEKVWEKTLRALAVARPAQFVAGKSIFQDASALWPVEVDQLDAVITSPPFFDSTRFYLANWMRLWFAGWSAVDFKRRPLAFVDERQKADIRIYQPILRQARERLKTGGVCVLHLGKSRKCDMAEEISKMARFWFAKSEVFAESVSHCESHGIRDKGTVVEHTYLVLH